MYSHHLTYTCSKIALDKTLYLVDIHGDHEVVQQDEVWYIELQEICVGYGTV